VREKGREAVAFFERDGNRRSANFDWLLGEVSWESRQTQNQEGVTQNEDDLQGWNNKLKLAEGAKDPA